MLCMLYDLLDPYKTREVTVNNITEYFNVEPVGLWSVHLVLKGFTYLKTHFPWNPRSPINKVSWL